MRLEKSLSLFSVMTSMRYTILFTFLLLSCASSFGQGKTPKEKKRLFGGREINIRVFFFSPYYEIGNNRIDHFGYNAGISIYRRLFLGAYQQRGNWKSAQEGSNFKSKYRHSGLMLGYVNRIKKTKFSIIPSCYFGIGKSTSRQSSPIAFSDAQVKFNVLTPEIGLSYRFNSFFSLMVSTGYHFYSRTDEDDPPVGFEGFDLNSNYGRIILRIGI